MAPLRRWWHAWSIPVVYVLVVATFVIGLIKIDQETDRAVRAESQVRCHAEVRARLEVRAGLAGARTEAAAADAQDTVAALDRVLHALPPLFCREVDGVYESVREE